MYCNVSIFLYLSACFGTAAFWEGTKDGLNYSNMVTCYNWDGSGLGSETSPCPGPNFAEQNMNYEKTDPPFSYYVELSCSVTDEDIDAVVVVADPTDSTDSSDTAADANSDVAATAPTETASESGGNHNSSFVLLITIGTWLFLTTLSTNNNA